MICDTCGDDKPRVETRDGCGDDRLCDDCHKAALVHGHAHGIHTDDDSVEPAAHCPMCHSAVLMAIAKALNGQGITAHVEYPGFVGIDFPDGRYGALGNSNGPWEVDVWASIGRHMEGLQPGTVVNVDGTTPSEIVMMVERRIISA